VPIFSSRWCKGIFITIVLGIVASGTLALYLVESVGAPPRVLAPYIERRALGHNPVIVGIGKWMAKVMTALDRGSNTIFLRMPVLIGAQENMRIEHAPVVSQAVVHVNSIEDAVKAISQANPGDVIVLVPGTYQFRGSYIAVTRPGASDRRIVVRAERVGTVILELDAREGFSISAPYWTFENLFIRGICREHTTCDHAFHVSGDAHHFIARNNRIVDFNAHFKINGNRGRMPDDGIIDGNTLTNTSIRNTDHPVTPIDLVAASGWTIRRNLITDFVKGGSDQISYGGFVKGAGSDNRFEQNVVICENTLKGMPGRRVGLSLGGGGTGESFCRDRRCITEQDNGVIASNLIASCSDDGIYVNRSARSKVLHNTVVDTGGIVVRFPESSAELEGNLVDGSIRSRDDGIVRKIDNVETSMTSAYLGIHPVRNLYADNSSSNFSWGGAPPRRKATSWVPIDLCGIRRPSEPTYGAFEDFSACLIPKTATKN
jgi:parallel beta-helix repeat protein